jgi:hypothetical protein
MATTDAMAVGTEVTSAENATISSAQVYNLMYPDTPCSGRDTQHPSDRTLQYSVHDEGSPAPAALNEGQVSPIHDTKILPLSSTSN